MSPGKWGLILGALLVVVALLGLRTGQSRSAPKDNPAPHVVVLPDSYSCPMHPEVTSDHEGRCPICGMELVRNSAGHSTSHTGAFHVPADVQKRMGLVLETVSVQDFNPSLSVPAQVVADERRAVNLSPKVDGWLRRLRVSVVGQPVRTGQVLFELYSPELQQRQRDYLDILARRDALTANAGSMGATLGNSAPDLMLASVARERFRMRSQLAAADVPEAVLVDLEKTRHIHEVVPVLAEHDGVVTGISAREGAYVMPAQTVVSYADLSAVWAELQLDPEQLGWLHERETVKFRSTIDRTVTTTVRFNTSFAVVDPVSRVVHLRTPLATSGRKFLPGTLLEADIVLAGRRALTVDVEALIYTGHGDFVIVADEDGAHFRQVPVQTRARSERRVEIIGGLAAGQKVVTNGQFLLSAEASLQSTRRLTDMPHAHD